MNGLSTEKGSATLEMTLMFPMILFIIVIMLFFGMFMYEQVAAQAILDDVVSRAAANWATADEGVYVENSANAGFTVWDVYSRILDFKDSKKEENIKSEALRRLKQACLFTDTFESGDLDLDSTNVIIYKSLDLTVDRTYTLPFAGFLRALGVSPELHYRLTGSAIVEDPPELIRTVDLAADILEMTKLGTLMTKFQDALGKLSDFFRNFDLNRQ